MSRPLVILRLDDASGATPPDFESLFTALESLKQEVARSSAGVVFDLTGGRPDAARRKRLVEWLQKEGGAVSERVPALGLVAPSGMLRGAITAISWFVRHPATRFEVFETRAAATAWVTEHLPSPMAAQSAAG